MVLFKVTPTSTISRFDQKVPWSFFRYGIVADHPRSGSTRFGTEVVWETENKCCKNPLLSNRNPERELKIPISTIRHVLQKKQKMFPYKISFLQQVLSKYYVESQN